MAVAWQLTDVQDQSRIDQSPGHRQQGSALAQAALQALSNPGQGLGADAIGPADQHQVGGLQLIVEQVLDGTEVIKAGIGQALGLHRAPIADHMASCQGLAIHHRDDGVDPGPGADLGPVESGHQGLWQGQTTGFNDDAIEAIRLLQQLRHRRQELVLHGATEAAIGQFHQPTIEVLFGAEATAGDQVTVNADFAEFVDQHGQALAAVQQQMTQQGGLAGAKEARHHGDRQARSSWCCHLSRPVPTRSRRHRNQSGQRPATAAQGP